MHKNKNNKNRSQVKHLCVIRFVPFSTPSLGWMQHVLTFTSWMRFLLRQKTIVVYFDLRLPQATVNFILSIIIINYICKVKDTLLCGHSPFFEVGGKKEKQEITHSAVSKTTV